MNPITLQNVAHSVRQRLFNLAREQREEFQIIMTRYAFERLLYRLNKSEYRDEFVLKGAMLFYLFNPQIHRTTRDLDLLGSGEISVPRLEMIFKKLCKAVVEDDGLSFLEDTVRAMEIQENQENQGVRVQLTALLTNARIPLQIDVGFGDSVIPDPEIVEYPTLLNYHAPHIRIYPKDSIIAEKFQTMVRFGIANSRMKDFYDIWFLAHNFSFEGETLSRAIQATFERRRTPLPKETPLALTSEFFYDSGKQAQWRAFIQRGLFDSEVPTLKEVANFLEGLLMPPTRAMVLGKDFILFWDPSGPWQ